LQAFHLETLDIDNAVGDPFFQSKVGRTFSTMAPALERALRDAEPMCKLLLVQMADL
jgi:hypothetical protein